MKKDKLYSHTPSLGQSQSVPRISDLVAQKGLQTEQGWLLGTAGDLPFRKPTSTLKCVVPATALAIQLPVNVHPDRQEMMAQTLGSPPQAEPGCMNKDMCT